MSVKKLLLVEDDEDLGNVLKQYLGIKGYDVSLERSGEDGLISFREQHPDLCVLDIALPKMTGLELGRRIKLDNNDQPIVFLTARTSKEFVLKGLQLGADDYICKPFEPEELVLRINNILKRSGNGNQEILSIGKYLFNPDRLELKGYGNIYRLTLKETELLRYLFEQKCKLVKREDILLKLWGENDYFLGRSLDVFISRIRKYLKHDSGIKLETIRGIGYIMKLNCD